MVIGGAMDISTSSPTPKPKPFTNGAGAAVKDAAAATTTYRECLKNHAASIGGHALDGCGEFMPSPTAAADPTSLKCAACGCHRNFHRRHHPDDPPAFAPPPPHSRSRSSSPGPTPSPSPSPQSPPPVSHFPPNSFFSPHPAPAQMLLALSSGGLNATAALRRKSAESSRKRFRTKFSAEQKARMCSFAEKLGWKMQRGEDKTIECFCNEIGVRKGVLKVWMHNNKHTIGKIERSSLLVNHHDDHHQHTNSSLNFFTHTNASSSSS